MLNNNNHFSCAFAGQIVSYIYDEATAAERKEFETHLPNCLSCADEIAGFGLVRSSINEWRKKDEIFTLDAPALEIPNLRTANLAQTVSSEKVSLFDELRKLFTISPAWAAGFAALIVCVGLIWLFFGNSKNDLAANINKQTEVPPAVENKSVEQSKEETASVTNSQTEDSTDVPQKVEEVEQKPNSPRNKAVKAANTTPKLKSVTPKTNNAMAENRQNNRNKSRYVQKQTTPTLSDMKEEEDNSLRLSELFEEIGTR